MADGPPPAVITAAGHLDDLTAKIRRDLEAASRSIDAEIARILESWPSDPRPVRLRVLRGLREHVQTLMVAARETAAATLPDALSHAYDLGATRTALAADQAVSFAAIDRSALATLAQDGYGELLEATTHVEDTTKDLVRRLARDHARDRVLTGQTAQQAARDLARALEGGGVSAITYRNGARHTLATYSDMVIRTKTAQAYQVGGFNQGRQLGIQWYEILDNPTCGLDGHDDPTKANGQIVTLETAERFAISHPNCVRVSAARPDIRSRADALARDAKSTTASQDADQQLVSMAREDAAARRAGTTARDIPNRPGLGTRLPERTTRVADQPAAASAAARRRASKVAAREAQTATAADPLAGLEQLGLDQLDELAGTRPELFADPATIARLDARYAQLEAELEAQPVDVAQALLKRTNQLSDREAQAIKDWYAEQARVDEQLIAARAQTPPARTRPRESAARQAQREDYDLWLETTIVEAERATSGHVLSAEGKRAGATLADLFAGDPRTAVRYASEELLRWWEADTRRRISWTEWRGPKTRSGRQSREAFEQTLKSWSDKRSRARRR